MLTIHHLGISVSERIVWLCEELGLPYEVRRYERDAIGMAPPEYKALHPAGTAPVISDDGGLVLAESGAVAEYIARRHGGGRFILGPDHSDFAQYLFWFHYANSSLMAAVITDAIGAMSGIERASPRSDIPFRVVEERLGEARWFAGDEFTLADILLVYPLTRARAHLQRDISRSPNTLAYLQRVGERPAFRAAMAKAEPGLPPPLS